MSFEEAKEETYSLFTKRCRRLLTDFLREKDEAVCSQCSESCKQGEKVHRALRYLVETLTVAAAKRCDDKADIFLCVLCPYLSSVHIMDALGRGKMVKHLAREMDRGHRKLVDIIKEGERESAKLQRH